MRCPVIAPVPGLVLAAVVLPRATARDERAGTAAEPEEPEPPVEAAAPAGPVTDGCGPANGLLVEYPIWSQKSRPPRLQASPEDFALDSGVTLLAECPS